MIGDFVGDSVTLIDPGKLTAIAAATALDDLGISSGRSTGGTTRFLSAIPRTASPSRSGCSWAAKREARWNRSPLKRIKELNYYGKTC